MGKIINFCEAEPSAVPQQTKNAPDVVRGEAAEKLHILFTKPADAPTPRMVRAIENYNRLMAMKRSTADEPKP